MDAWDEVQVGFPGQVRKLLNRVPVGQRQATQEIRLRTRAPIGLTVRNRLLYVQADGSLSDRPGQAPLLAQADLDETVRLFCGGSLYAREQELRLGYIRLEHGHRIGVAGLFSEENGNFLQATSVNVRLARSVSDAWRTVLSEVDRLGPNILIAGPPGSGKTTLLREMARRYAERSLRVGIADERGEITGSGAFDIAGVSDSIIGLPKAKAISMLLRFLNPQVLLFDELADQSQEIAECCRAGVRVVTSLHADTLTGAKKRLQQMQIPADLFQTYILLDGDQLGQVKEMACCDALASDCRDFAFGMDPHIHRVSFEPTNSGAARDAFADSASDGGNGEPGAVLSHPHRSSAGDPCQERRVFFSR